MSNRRIAIALASFIAFGACNTSSDAASTADLTVNVVGLPSVPADIKVTSPSGYSQLVTETTTLKGLTPGWYLITAWYVAGANQLFAPTPESLQVELKRPDTTVTLAYSLASGSMAIAISGLPGGVNANIAVNGPGYYKLVTSSQTVTGLMEGTYTITGKTAVNGSTTYGGAPYTQTVVVSASATPVNAAVAYSAMTGQLAVSVSGLPGGTNPSVLVTGPFGYSHSIAASGTVTLFSLPLGDYTVTADSVLAGPAVYFPLTLKQKATLNAGTLSNYSGVSYQTSDLTIDGMYVTQVTQTYAGGVPLVDGRDGYLRVFVRASHPNDWTPAVRVRWYMNGSLVRTDTIAAPHAGVPVAIDEGTLTSSWNLPVPGSLIHSGLSVLADVDPSNAVAESDETNNMFPANGTPFYFTVYDMPPARVTLVPITTLEGRTGNVNAANMESYLSFMQKIHPISSHVGTLHRPVLIAANSLQPDDANGGWLTILSDLAALRVIEFKDFDEHYYGVMHLPYEGGIIGLGYVGYPAAIGSDRDTPDQILAHEIGHNWGRDHSPCGNPAGPDPNYPYPNGNIGAYGFDVPTRTLYDSRTTYDIMSYCTPYWISDYTYTGVMDFILGIGGTIPADHAGGTAAAEPALMVWGHMRGSEMVLEPALEVTTRPRMPSGSGAYTIDALDANGARLFSYAFDGDNVADEPGGARNFSFAIPVSRFDISRLASLRLSGPGRSVSVSASATAPTGLAARLRAGRAELRWNSAAFPIALVRDAATGEVLSFARGGVVNLGAHATNLVVTFSNGVRSTTETVRAQ